MGVGIVCHREGRGEGKKETATHLFFQVVVIFFSRLPGRVHPSRARVAPAFSRICLSHECMGEGGEGGGTRVWGGSEGNE